MLKSTLVTTLLSIVVTTSEVCGVLYSLRHRDCRQGLVVSRYVWYFQAICSYQLLTPFKCVRVHVCACVCVCFIRKPTSYTLVVPFSPVKSHFWNLMCECAWDVGNCCHWWRVHTDGQTYTHTTIPCIQLSTTKMVPLIIRLLLIWFHLYNSNLMSEVLW